jgi:hypothetical protein
MTMRVAARIRLVPPKINALLLTLLLLVMPIVFATALFGKGADYDSVTVNGEEVTGEERDRVVGEINRSILMSFLPLMVIGVWTARRLLPRSALDYVEISPEGLALRGIFGLTRFSWEEIAGIGVRALPSRVPFAWMTVRLASGGVRRFYLGGYIRIKLFSDLGEQSAAIADWFSQLKSAYRNGNATGVLPPAPWGFMGKAIELDTRPPGRVANRSVIER